VAYDPAMSIPDVRDSVRLVRDGEASARELVQRSLDAVAEIQGTLNAFVHVDAEGALAAADDVDRARAAGEPLGPLAGVPFGVKDLEDCIGMPTRRGSRWYADARPATRDDIHVERFRAAGAIPIGKTAAPEFGAFGYTASPLHGVTRNPWNPERTPGGSSGGTAAAVSAGAIPFGTASDGGGSVRGPAASCGLPGLKPTYGRVPTFGVTRHAGNAVNFALATTIADTALLFDVAAGPDMRDRTSLPAPGFSCADAIEQLDVAGLRSAWSSDLGFVTTDPEVVAHHRACGSDDGGCSVAGRHGPRRADRRLHPNLRVHGERRPVRRRPRRLGGPARRTRPAGGRRLATEPSRHTPPVRQGRGKPAGDWSCRSPNCSSDIDVLLTPTNPCAPFAAEGPMPTEIAGQRCHAGTAALLTMLANVANLPAITVPAGLTADGLPVGLHDHHRPAPRGSVPAPRPHLRAGRPLAAPRPVTTICRPVCVQIRVTRSTRICTQTSELRSWVWRSRPRTSGRGATG
jgi:aspartyl-tRNA(Asn)/glutamyl-tRNA(Gln) amidotransferase subunit A